MISIRTYIGVIVALCLLVLGAYYSFAPTSSSYVYIQADVSNTGDTSTVIISELSVEATSSVVVDHPIPEPAKPISTVLPVTPIHTEVNKPAVIAPTDIPTTPPTLQGFTKAHVAEHASEQSCWSIINNNVYDLTSYVSKHPGGKKNILKLCGHDGTALFEGKHGGESKPESRLAGLYKGTFMQ